MSDAHTGVILEDIQDKLQLLAESMGVMQQDITEMKPQVARIPGMADDIAVMKAVLKNHETWSQDHEGRLQVLEMPARA